MEITKNNFNETLPSVKEAIDQCDFLCIDTELTGLYSEPTTEHAFDSMDERYTKLYELCSKFLVTQYGVSTFKYHPLEKKYTHKDFNFYVFPNPHIRQAPDQRFLCQTSSLHFLASHGFNFNKVIYEGVPYLRHDHEDKLKDFISNKYKSERNIINTSKENGQKEINIPDEHKEFIAEINKRVDSFVSNESETEFNLDPCSGYRRKLIYETVQQRHKTGIELESKMNADKERFIVIVKSSDSDKLAKLGQKETYDMDNIDTAIGFRKVLQHISQSKKLVIGHHMFLDIFHTINQFFHPLPENLREYKEMLHLIFPRLLDTKILASSDQLRPFLDSTGLGDLYKCVQGKAFDLPTIESDEGFKGYDMSGTNYHEAGFDAFITGVSFIGLSQKLGFLSKSAQHIDPFSKILSPFVNRFFVYRHFDIPSINICGPDPEPNRDNVFYVSFPPEWKTVDLVELFLPYGEIYVHWLDDISALVALKNTANIISAKSGLLKRSSKMYSVRTYADYKKMTGKLSSAKEVELRKPIHPVTNPATASKRSSTLGGLSNIYLIPEDDENEAEEAQLSKPPAKKLKKSREEPESGEVTSTFEEGDNW